MVSLPPLTSLTQKAALVIVDRTLDLVAPTVARGESGGESESKCGFAPSVLDVAIARTALARGGSSLAPPPVSVRALERDLRRCDAGITSPPQQRPASAAATLDAAQVRHGFTPCDAAPSTEAGRVLAALTAGGSADAARALAAAATPPRPGSGELQRLCSAVRCDPEYYRCISCESCSQFDSLP